MLVYKVRVKWGRQMLNARQFAKNKSRKEIFIHSFIYTYGMYGWHNKFKIKVLVNGQYSNCTSTNWSVDKDSPK